VECHHVITCDECDESDDVASVVTVDAVTFTIPVSPLTMMSDAAAAATGTTRNLKKVNFIYTESIPSGSISIVQPPITLVNNDLYKSVSTAQNQFSQKDENLKELDTSGDLDEYVVSQADGKIVGFNHQDDVPMVCIQVH
jgi:hypothetical protein